MRARKWLNVGRSFLIMFLTLALGVTGVSAYADRVANQTAARQVAEKTAAAAAAAAAVAQAAAKPVVTAPAAPTVTKPVTPKPPTRPPNPPSRGENMVVTADGKSVTYRGLFSMVATAYDATVESNGQWGPVCALDGSRLRPGMIAVDPSVIPLGSKVFVTGYTHPALPIGGFVGIAADTGSAIKGNRIDIYLEAAPKSVSSFGFQNVKVYVLDK